MPSCQFDKSRRKICRVIVRSYGWSGCNQDSSLFREESRVKRPNRLEAACASRYHHGAMTFAAQEKLRVDALGSLRANEHRHPFKAAAERPYERIPIFLMVAAR